MGDPGVPMMAGLLAVPVIVLLFVAVLALVSGRSPAPADVYEEPEDVVADFEPWPYAPAEAPAPVPAPSTALAPRSYGSLGRDPHQPAYDSPYGYQAAYGAADQRQPYWDDSYGPAAHDPYGQNDAPGGEPNGFPYGPYRA